jgi:hypothetical protein
MTLKGHFDGKFVVLDEPASLEVGQAVRVIVESALPVDLETLRRRTDESLKSTREAFASSGMSDDELAEYLEIQTHAMRGIPYERR